MLSNILNWLFHVYSSELVKPWNNFYDARFWETAPSFYFWNPKALTEQKKKPCHDEIMSHAYDNLLEYLRMLPFNHNVCNMSSSNVLYQEYYCKYYRLYVFYCIQNNWYLPLYRKIKSLLYIQPMTGVRGLPWKQDQHFHKHTAARTKWFTDNKGTCPWNTRSHSHTLARMQICHTHISSEFLWKTGRYTVITEQITREVKFRITQTPPFPLPKRNVTELSCQVIRCQVVCVWLFEPLLQFATVNLHLVTSSHNRKRKRKMTEEWFKITSTQFSFWKYDTMDGEVLRWCRCVSGRAWSGVCVSRHISLWGSNSSSTLG